MNKQHQFELLPGLKVRVGDVMYRIVLQYQKADTYTLHSPAGSLCASKIVAYIERPFSEDCWVPVATGASYRQPEDMNQPDAPVCMYRTEGDSKGPACYAEGPCCSARDRFRRTWWSAVGFRPCYARRFKGRLV